MTTIIKGCLELPKTWPADAHADFATIVSVLADSALEDLVPEADAARLQRDYAGIMEELRKDPGAAFQLEGLTCSDGVVRYTDTIAFPADALQTILQRIADIYGIQKAQALKVTYACVDDKPSPTAYCGGEFTVYTRDRLTGWDLLEHAARTKQVDWNDAWGSCMELDYQTDPTVHVRISGGGVDSFWTESDGIVSEVSTLGYIEFSRDRTDEDLEDPIDKCSTVSIRLYPVGITGDNNTIIRLLERKAL